MIQAEAKVLIDAPIERVWEVMIDVGAYREWNPFIVDVETAAGAPVVGKAMRLTAARPHH